MKSYNYEKKNGQILFKLGVEESFLTMAQNSDAIKEKIDKLDYIKYIKTVCQKVRSKRQLKLGENIQNK